MKVLLLYYYDEPAWARMASEAPSVYPDRSAAPCRARASCQELDKATLHCAACYPPQLASSGLPLVLETAIEASLEEPQHRCRDRHIDQNHGAEQLPVERLPQASSSNASSRSKPRMNASKLSATNVIW
jgi:hypothetical protein